MTRWLAGVNGTRLRAIFGGGRFFHDIDYSREQRDAATAKLAHAKESAPY